MRLTRYTDYGLRVLTHLAERPDRLWSIAEIAAMHRVSENHLMKVVQGLGRAGFLTTVRGRGGGVRLARSAQAITVGEVVRSTEEDCTLADCANCVLSAGCRLTGALAEARRAFFAVLDGYSIAEVAGPPQPALAPDSLVARGQP